MPTGRMFGFMAAAADGKLWLIGGQNSQGLLGDVWSFDPTNNQWTLEAGSQSPVAPSQASYGRFRVPAASNLMPSRVAFGGAMDKRAGMIFLSGGVGAEYKALGDVWSFNVTSKLFTWIAGQPGEKVRGTYPAVKGLKGGELRAARPNSYAGNAWVDASGGLWLGMGMHENDEIGEDQLCDGTTTKSNEADRRTRALTPAPSCARPQLTFPCLPVSGSDLSCCCCCCCAARRFPRQTSGSCRATPEP